MSQQCTCEDLVNNGDHYCPIHGTFAAPPSVSGETAHAPECKGCKDGSLDSFEHDGCFVDKVLDKELGRWQQAIYELCRKHAIAPDEIDGKGCDSGDPLDLTLAEIGQVICQLENPQDYRPEPAPLSGEGPLYTEEELKAEGLKASTIHYGAEGKATMYSKDESVSGEGGERKEVRCLGCGALAIHWKGFKETTELLNSLRPIPLVAAQGREGESKGDAMPKKIWEIVAIIHKVKGVSNGAERQRWYDEIERILRVGGSPARIATEQKCDHIAIQGNRCELCHAPVIFVTEMWPARSVEGREINWLAEQCKRVVESADILLHWASMQGGLWNDAFEELLKNVAVFRNSGLKLILERAALPGSLPTQPTAGYTTDSALKQSPESLAFVEAMANSGSLPSPAPPPRRKMRASPLDDIHDECPDCRGTCSPVEQSESGPSLPSEETRATTRNSTVLAGFVAYCAANPGHRFWQALRNWSGYHFILAADMGKGEPVNARDTFNWEGRNDHE